MADTPVPRLARLVDRVAWALTDSWDYHVFGAEHLRQAVRSSPTRTVMMVLWHQDLLMMAGSVSGRGMRLAALVSRSGDGTLIAHHLERRGVETVRGSSRKGAVAAARGLLELGAAGRHLCIAIDGPKGPAKETRTGPLDLARSLGLPVVPVAARATSEWRLPTWDRLRVPTPGAQVVMAFGPPLVRRDGDDVEEARRQLAEQMLILGQEAARLCRQPDLDPPEHWTAWLRRRHGCPPASA